jgi:hypothetical protein
MDHQVKEEKRMQRGFTGGHTYDPDGKTKYLPKYIHKYISGTNSNSQAAKTRVEPSLVQVYVLGHI